MNRILTFRYLCHCSVPHARGDEPQLEVGLGRIKLVFPTPVGMNRSCTNRISVLLRVPHARGDEPQLS